MKNSNELKKELLDQLSEETENCSLLQEAVKNEPHIILGEDFTSTVVKAAKATRKTPQVIKFTRIALPFAACAAAVLIFVSVGLHDSENSPIPKDLDTVNLQNDIVVSDPIKNKDDDFDTIPSSDDEEERLPATADSPLEESPEDAEPDSAPPSSAGSSQKDNYGKDSSEGENTYTFNMETIRLNVIAFLPADSVEETNLEIKILISDVCEGKAFFGDTVSFSQEGEEYEVIATKETTISRAELLNMLDAYIDSLCDMMNSHNGTSEWQIEILYDTLPQVIEPNSIIKIIRTK